jgi:hypothetical protein
VSGGNSPSAALLAENCMQIWDLRNTELSIYKFNAFNSITHTYFQHSCINSACSEAIFTMGPPLRPPRPLVLALCASQAFTALSTTFDVAIRFLLALVEAFVGFDQEQTSHEPFLVLVVSYSNSVLWQGR